MEVKLSHEEGVELKYEICSDFINEEDSCRLVSSRKNVEKSLESFYKYIEKVFNQKKELYSDLVKCIRQLQDLFVVKNFGLDIKLQNFIDIELFNYIFGIDMDYEVDYENDYECYDEEEYLELLAECECYNEYMNMSANYIILLAKAIKACWDLEIGGEIVEGSKQMDGIIQFGMKLQSKFNSIKGIGAVGSYENDYPFRKTNESIRDYGMRCVTYINFKIDGVDKGNKYTGKPNIAKLVMEIESKDLMIASKVKDILCDICNDDLVKEQIYNELIEENLEGNEMSIDYDMSILNKKNKSR